MKGFGKSLGLSAGFVAAIDFVFCCGAIGKVVSGEDFTKAVLTGPGDQGAAALATMAALVTKVELPSASVVEQYGAGMCGLLHQLKVLASKGTGVWDAFAASPEVCAKLLPAAIGELTAAAALLVELSERSEKLLNDRLRKEFLESLPERDQTVH
jgi:hypothetical protein